MTVLWKGERRPRLLALAVGLASLGGCDDGILDHREAGSTIPPEATVWLQGNVHPIDGTSLQLPGDDLTFLHDLVGDARVVALGENTHGTRDFFEMKARILRYLVEEMGFDAFAIEGSWPEANRIDDYVRTGEGDAARLIAGMYFWTWRTQSVLEMTRWIRQHNAAGGDVGFYGFDMQFPGMAIHNVQTYLAAVDADALDSFQDRLACLADVANDANGVFPARYRHLAGDVRDACRADLEWVRAELASRREAYVAVSSPGDFERALHSARLLLQYEAMESGLRSRDASMAENARWLLEQLGPEGRMVLWAHNYHVGYADGAMGEHLRGSLGDALVTVGFTHTSGSFTAASSAGFGQYALDPMPEESYEAYFHTTGIPRFALDLRPRYAQSDSTRWLAGPLWTRSIGASFEANGGEYWRSESLPGQYDVVIHLDRTRATELLDVTAPGVW